MDETIHKITILIRDHYIDRKLGEKVANEIKKFVKSPVWERHSRNSNGYTLLWRINCIIQSITDDGHFNIVFPMQITSRQGVGIERYTSHFIRINYLAQPFNEKVRIEYSKFFKQAKSPLILDLRNCPGGSPELAYYILCHFFKDNIELFRIVGRDLPTKIFKSASTIPFYVTHNKIHKFTGDIKVLVSNVTASAAELITFIIKGLNRGKIYGSRTSSHGHMVIPYKIDNVIVNLPYAKAVDANGRTWEGHGILPDYDVMSKEYIDLIYKEIAVDTFAPIQMDVPSVGNPFYPPKYAESMP